MKITQSDVTGYQPRETLIGRKFVHAVTHEVYTITGFIWFGDMDRWLISHTRAGEHFARTPENLNGYLLDGTKRISWE